VIRPDDDEQLFVVRWNRLIRLLLVAPSTKLVAVIAMSYGDAYDGSRVRPSAERLARDTGYDERTVRKAWAILRGLSLAERADYGPVSGKRMPDEYQLVIPDDWEHLPVLGPSEGRFHCLHCGHAFNPQAHNVLKRKGEDWRVSFFIDKFCFCPQPRKGQGCLGLWDSYRPAAQRWNQLDGPEQWKAFRQARGEDW
jgi:hypothetical protein